MTPIIEAVRRHNEQYNRGCTLTPAKDIARLREALDQLESEVG